jgi:O-antigen/teichoic acid export membrane protein
MRSSLSRNTITLLTSNVGSAALSFILSVLIGRVLKQDGLGVYTAALAWVFPLSLIAEFGLGSLMTRDIAQTPDSADEYLRSTTLARLWIGGALTLALVILAPILSDDPAVIAGLRISAPLIIILPFFGAFTAIFRARQAMWPIPPLNVGMLVIQVALTALVFLAGGGVLAALIVNTLTSAGQLVAAWAVWRWKFHAPSPTPNNLSLKIMPLLRRAWPFALAAVLAALQTRAGTILLEKLTDTAQVGYYAAGTRFIEAARMIPNALFGALFPALAALIAQPDAFRRTFRKVTLGLSGFGIALGLICTFFATIIMSLTYGAAFIPAIPVLQIAMWSLLPGLLRAGRTLYWYALGREQYTNIVTGATLIAQIALSLWLIPLAGASGAAIVSLVTETLALILLWLPETWLSKKTS